MIEYPVYLLLCIMRERLLFCSSLHCNEIYLKKGLNIESKIKKIMKRNKFQYPPVTTINGSDT